MFFRKKRSVDRGNGLDPKHLPKHIAIIMDGNGRWAQKHGLPRSLGHREGANNLRKIARTCDRIGIQYLTVYAFSTENWKRPQSEVDTLMGLLYEFLKNADKDIEGNNIRISIIGKKQGLSEHLVREIDRIESKTAGNTGFRLMIALNYGGRDEIMTAVRRIAQEVANGALSVEAIDDAVMEKYLYTSEIPAPDMIIRTSGEQRLSNFLLWQSAYSEFCFSDVLWPDFSERHIIEAIQDFCNRNRRFGGI